MYGGGPEILVSAGSQLVTVGTLFLLGIYPFTQVRPPRPATICALAQRLRLRSESQREEVVEEQACQSGFPMPAIS